MSLPFLNLTPRREGEEGPVVDAIIPINSSASHIDGLYLGRSGVALDEPGLFSMSHIPPGKLIGFYTGTMIRDESYEKLSVELKRILGKYAVSMEGVDVTISPLDPLDPERGVDYMRDPFSLANEPAIGTFANCVVESRVVETGLAQYSCVCLFACTRIEGGDELTWRYGPSYTRNYVTGMDCPSVPSRLEDPLDMLLDSLAHHPSPSRVAFQVDDEDSEDEDSLSQEFDPHTESSVATNARLATLHTHVKRQRGTPESIFEGFDPVNDAEECLNRYNALAVEIGQLEGVDERVRAVESLNSADQLLLDFLEDQASICTVYGDVETTELIRHGTPIGDMQISVASLLFEESDGSESMTLSFWGDDTLGRGAPLRFLRHAMLHAKQLVFYNSKFDNAVVAAGDDVLFSTLQNKTHDPYLLLREAFPRGVSLKLDTLLRLNGIDPKTASGVEAVDMYASGRLDELQKYNERDVRALRELVKLDRIELGNGLSTRVGTLGSEGAGDSPSTSSQDSDDTEIIAVEQRSPEWFAVRCNRVTSTLVAAICDLSPFASREDAHDTLRGEAEPPQETEAMRSGIQREAEAIRRYETATGNRIESVGFVIPTDPRYKDWTGASPDGLGRYDKKLCVEVKVPANGRPTPKPSPAYFLQCQWHMFCSGRFYCDFVSLGTDAMTISRVQRDVDLMRFLLPHLRAFWEHAQTDDEFELDLDMRDRVEIREEVGASLAESVKAAKMVTI